jgi:hypothetical protein
VANLRDPGLAEDALPAHEDDRATDTASGEQNP